MTPIVAKGRTLCQVCGCRNLFTGRLEAYPHVLYVATVNGDGVTICSECLWLVSESESLHIIVPTQEKGSQV